MSTSEFPAQRLGIRRLRSIPWIGAARLEVVAVAALVLIAAAIRLAVLDNQSFWQDEALTAYEAGLPFGAMLHTVLHVETTPPLYFVLIWAWAHIFGTGEAALRSVSMLAGIAVVPITYLAARELVSRSAGVIAAAFVAVNPFMIWFSQEARAYMLLCALTAASFLWFTRCRRDPSRRNVAWWALCSSLAVMTHFFAGFAVAPEAAWLLWTARSRRVGTAVGVVALVQLAMVPLAFVDTSHSATMFSSWPRLTRLASVPLEWGGGTFFHTTELGVLPRLHNAPGKQVLVAAALLAAVVVFVIVRWGERAVHEGAKVAGVVGGFALLAPVALMFLGADYFLARNVTPAFVPLLIVLAAVCAMPRTRAAGAAVAVVVLAFFSIATAETQTNPLLQRPNWKAVARSLGTSAVPRVIFSAGGTNAQALKIYLPRVAWAMPRTLSVKEVDVVGLLEPQQLLPRGARIQNGSLATSLQPFFGLSVPRRQAPRGGRVLSRFRIGTWMVARFALRRTTFVDRAQILRFASRFYRHVPRSLLVVLQAPVR